jgi:hypothetical protein
MSPQDSQMLHDFLSQLIQARGIQKDPEADSLIQRAVAQQPDAAYLLVQRSLLLEQALKNAKGQVAQLENQLRSAQQGDRRFLDANAWGNSGGERPANAPVQQERREYQRDYPPAQHQPQFQPQYQQPSMMGGMFGARPGGFLGGGLLGSIAATAAGVAAGNFLFHGLDNMFHHHNQGGSNHLLNSEDQGSNLFSDQSGSSLADQAGLGDVGNLLDNGSSSNNFLDSGNNLLDNGPSADNLFDRTADSGIESGLDSGIDSGLDGLDGGGFFDGDGSDEGLFG